MKIFCSCSHALPLRLCKILMERPPSLLLFLLSLCWSLRKPQDFPCPTLRALSASVLLHGPSAFYISCSGGWVNPKGGSQRMGPCISISIKQSHSSQLPFRQHNNPIPTLDRSVYNPGVLLLPSSKMKQTHWHM